MLPLELPSLNTFLRALVAFSISFIEDNIKMKTNPLRYDNILRKTYKEENENIYGRGRKRIKFSKSRF